MVAQRAGRAADAAHQPLSRTSWIDVRDEVGAAVLLYPVRLARSRVCRPRPKHGPLAMTVQSDERLPEPRSPQTPGAVHRRTAGAGSRTGPARKRPQTPRDIARPRPRPASGAEPGPLGAKPTASDPLARWAWGSAGSAGCRKPVGDRRSDPAGVNGRVRLVQALQQVEGALWY